MPPTLIPFRYRSFGHFILMSRHGNPWNKHIFKTRYQWLNLQMLTTYLQQKFVSWKVKVWKCRKQKIKIKMKKLIIIPCLSCSLSIPLIKAIYRLCLRHTGNHCAKTLTSLLQTSLIASVNARDATYCNKGTTRPSSICMVKENIRQPFGDSHAFFDRPACNTISISTY